jgi:hypothetical protein
LKTIAAIQKIAFMQLQQVESGKQWYSALGGIQLLDGGPVATPLISLLLGLASNSNYSGVALGTQFRFKSLPFSSLSLKGFIFSL